MNERNSSMSNSVYLPGVPLPIVLSSNLTTGTTPLVVTAMKSSSADMVCSGVKDFSTISRFIFLAASITNLRVMEGRMLLVSGAVCSFCLNIAKKAEAAPSVINPDSSTKIASSQPFFAASVLARTLGRRLSDFISHLFHRQSGCVDTAIPFVFGSVSSGSSVTVRKKFGFKLSG